MRGRTCLIVLGLSGLCCSLAASCGDMDGYIGSVYRVGGGSGGSSGSTAGSGGRGGGNACKGVCVRPGPALTGTPAALLWTGAKDMMPMDGPLMTSILRYRGYNVPIAPLQCEPCTCGTLTHSCSLPTSLTAFDQPKCPAGQQGQSFNAASGWTGTCDDNNPIHVPNGVQSLLIEAMDFVESCTPQPATPKPVGGTSEDWAIAGVAFEHTADGDCDNPVDTCMAKLDELPAGYHICMMHEGFDPGCATQPGEYTETHRFYGAFDDHRTCTPCTCTPPAVKGTCQSFLSVYQNIDISCNGPEVTPGVSVSSDKPTCVDINPSGQQLGSKSATLPLYTPAPGGGACQPGGGQAGGSVDLDPKKMTTFCCIP